MTDGKKPRPLSKITVEVTIYDDDTLTKKWNLTASKGIPDVRAYQKKLHAALALATGSILAAELYPPEEQKP